MRFFSCLALLVPSVLCSITTSLISSTLTTEVCSTRKTSISAKNVPTSIAHEVAPPVVIVALLKSTPHKTVTPKASTSTHTVTALVTSTLTASASTNIFSTTSTIYETATLIQTTTNLAVVTVTASTTVATTAIITTPAGFITIDTTTGEENIGQTPAKRDQNHPHAPGKASLRSPPSGARYKGGFCDKNQIYPAAVNCKCLTYLKTF